MATASSCGQACACWAFSQVHGRSQPHGGKHRSARHSGTHLHIAGVDLAHHRLPHAFQVQGRNLLWGGVPTDRGGEQRQAGRPLELVSKQVWWRRGVRALLHGTGPCFAAHAAHACSWSAVTDHPAASAFPPEAAVGAQHRVQDAVGGCTLQALAQRAVVAQVLWDPRTTRCMLSAAWKRPTGWLAQHQRVHAHANMLLRGLAAKRLPPPYPAQRSSAHLLLAALHRSLLPARLLQEQVQQLQHRGHTAVADLQRTKQGAQQQEIRAEARLVVPALTVGKCIMPATHWAAHRGRACNTNCSKLLIIVLQLVHAVALHAPQSGSPCTQTPRPSRARS